MPEFYPNDIHDHHHHHHDDCEHKAAPCCDDELPLFSTLGRGIKGDSFKVRIASDNCTETYLEGLSYDEATKEWHSEWISENVNGGELSYQYNLRPFTIPQTFTITFIYRRPNRHPDRTHTGIDRPANEDKTKCEWSWTTPAIPYIWSIDDDGNKTDPDAHVGSGVATIFVRASKSEAWSTNKHERLHYPNGTTRDDYNAPLPEKAWSATITFGHGGDVEIPNFDDLAKILGVTKGDIFNILEDKSFTIDGITATNYRDWLLKHLHKDLGFESDGATGSGHGWNNKFGGEANVKDYIDKWIQHLEDDLGFGNNMGDHDNVDDFGGEGNVKDYIDAKTKNLQNQINIYKKHIGNLYYLIDDLIGHIYGASVSTTDSNGTNSPNVVGDNQAQVITWNPNAKIPQGNINLFSGDTTHYIRTRDGENNDDLKGM